LLFDLIRALAAAAFVAVLPGWFWARCLCATADRWERITYSLALSMALVPAAALVPVRLLGVGVTFTVAATSALTVFFAGFLVYLRFGQAKGTYETRLSEPTSASTPVLLMLVPAFGLAFWAGLQMVPNQQYGLPRTLLAFVALFVLAAGVVHLVVSLRTSVPQEPTVEVASFGERSALVRRLLFPAVLLLVLFRGYSGPVTQDWPFIRGVDQYSHAVMANLMMSRGEIEPYLIYPPGFHTLTAMISRLSGLDPLALFPVLGPALLLLPALACYTLARRLWG
jgi:archaellum biogenesis protein FlaJ (TadC family)